jgi:hypothetical protein
MDNKTLEFLNSLDVNEKDELYRHLWRNYVVEDIKEYAEEYVEVLDVSTSQEMIEIATELFVSGGYDCNFSYWENIECVIEKATLITGRNYVEE